MLRLMLKLKLKQRTYTSECSGISKENEKVREKVREKNELMGLKCFSQ